MFKFCPQCGEPTNAVRPFQCPACETWHWANPKPTAGVLVEHRDEILLIKRAIDPWSNHWDIPGGFVEFGEHPEDGAVRELREETGLSLELTGIIGMWMDSYDTGDELGQLSILNIFYMAVIDPTEHRPTPKLDLVEATEWGWFAADALPSPIGFPNHQPAIIEEWADTKKNRTSFPPLPHRSKPVDPDLT